MSAQLGQRTSTARPSTPLYTAADLFLDRATARAIIRGGFLPASEIDTVVRTLLACRWLPVEYRATIAAALIRGHVIATSPAGTVGRERTFAWPPPGPLEQIRVSLSVFGKGIEQVAAAYTRALARMTVIDRGVEDGITWVTCQAPMYGAVNGYVRVPDDHPWHGKDYDDEALWGVEINGGLTFANADWIGFDTLHAGDYWPGGSHYCPAGMCDCTQWTEALVAEEARNLARQVARVIPPGVDQ